MGLCGPVDIFRAIREQGRDRVADLFLWKGGSLSFYRGQTAPTVEFPLDLDLPPLMLAGLEVAKPGESPVDEHRADFDRTIASSPGSDELEMMEGITWPPVVARVQALLKQPQTLRDLLKAVARSGELTAGDALRGLEILIAAGLAGWR
jgi:hypothetical protein